MYENKKNFTKLTPVKNADLKVYKEAFDYVFSNGDIRNIAISGTYGSGKSSILESYKNRHKEYKCIHISLAHFQNTKDVAYVSDSDSDTRKLEGKILNNLLQQVEKKDIPKTSFNIKRKTNSIIAKLDAILAALMALIILYICGFKAATGIIGSGEQATCFLNLARAVFSKEVWFVCLILGAIIICYFIFRLIGMQHNGNFIKKINIKGSGVELFDEKDDSYFDKYLNEIVYILKEIKVHCIIFEDIDRYENNKIFQQLREINTLVNQEAGDINSPLRFFYLLKDDMFESKERTKFFDFIIPIIPVVDSSNSYDKFLEIFAKEDTYSQIDPYFLQDICLYIDDMRILKNIYNEYVIYRSEIYSQGLNYSKLLAMVVYKNIFPKDFALLQNNGGYVHKILENKKALLEGKISEKEAEIKKLKNNLQLAENEYIAERKAIERDFAEKKEDLIQSGEEEQIEIEEREFENAIKASIGVWGLKKYELKEAIKSSEIERDKLKSKSIKELVNDSVIEELFSLNHIDYRKQSFNKVVNSDKYGLIKYLIREGYIDDTYQDYMAYFYPNSITKEDKAFIRSIHEGVINEYTYKIQEVQKVVNRIKADAFARSAILNFYVLLYLLDEENENEKLNKMLEAINRTPDFVRAFISSDMYDSRLIKILNSEYPDFIYKYINNPEISNDEKRGYILESLYTSNAEDIKAINIQNCITNFVSEDKDLLYTDVINVHLVVKCLKALNVKIKVLDFGCTNERLLAEVYKENLYSLNYENICCVLRDLYGVNQDNIVFKNYTTILNMTDTPIYDYVNDNIEDYVKVLLENKPGMFLEEESAVIKLLNNEFISIGYKEAFIKNTKTSITSVISILDKKLWSFLIEVNLLSYSIENVVEVYCYNNYTIDGLLVEYINSGHQHKYDYEQIETKYTDEIASKFFNSVIKQMELNNNVYKEIVDSMNRYYSEFDVEGIDIEKIKILVDINCIRMNIDTLVFMRENYEDAIEYYITCNIKDYIGIIDTNMFSYDELLIVLNSDVNYNHKLTLIKKTDEPISIFKIKYIPSVVKFVLENNYEYNDTPKLIEGYNSYGDTIRDRIEEIVAKNIAAVIKNKAALPFNLCIMILCRKDVQNLHKKQMLAISITGYDKKQIKRAIQVLGSEQLLRVVDGNRATLEISEGNKTLLEALKKKEWISSYKVKNNKYCVFGKMKTFYR